MLHVQTGRELSKIGPIRANPVHVLTLHSRLKH